MSKSKDRKSIKREKAQNIKAQNNVQEETEDLASIDNEEEFCKSKENESKGGDGMRESGKNSPNEENVEEAIPTQQFYENEEDELHPPQDLNLKLQIEKENSIALTKILKQLQADFDNYRKRNASVKENSYNEGVKDAIKRMLNCYDAVESALKSIKDEQVKEGMQILKREFLNAFEEFGITPIESLGHKFDENLHNAISSEDAPDRESGTIIQEIQKGFTGKDKVIRYSLVIIAK